MLRDVPRLVRGAALVGREVLKLAESGQILSSQIGWHPPTPAPVSRAAARKPRPSDSHTASGSTAGHTWPSSPVATPEAASAASPSQPSPEASPPAAAGPVGSATWAGLAMDDETEPPPELRAPSLPSSAAPDGTPDPSASAPGPAKEKGSSQRRVPVHPATRALHFGGLGLGLAAGAAAAAVRQTITGEKQANLLMSEANVERLAGTLCRLRGAALKVGQMLSFNDADVLPAPVRPALTSTRSPYTLALTLARSPYTLALTLARSPYTLALTLARSPYTLALTLARIPEPLPLPMILTINPYPCLRPYSYPILAVNLGPAIWQMLPLREGWGGGRGGGRKG
eukprot:scaffold8200_cov124-Isochrysis_galbana.AAC.2